MLTSRGDPRVIVGLSVLAVLAIGIVDAMTGPDLSVLTFYFVPVLFVTWYVGLVPGLALSALSAAAWAVGNYVDREHFTFGISVWNVTFHFAFFVFAVFAVSSLKKSLLREERSAREALERDMELALDVQAALLPTAEAMTSREFEISASCVQQRGIGGDFYEVLTGDDGTLLIALGDVAGKGVPAALLASTVLGGIRSLGQFRRGRIDVLVQDLNALIHLRQMPNRFATMFIAEFDAASSTLRWVNAGHNPPLLFRNGKLETRFESSGVVVGLFLDRVWKQCETRIEPGDLLVAFSDGVSESRNQNEIEFGEEGIVAAVAAVASRPAEEIQSFVSSESRKFSGLARPEDDCTVLVARRVTS